MDLPLLNDNLGGFSNARRAIPRSLEELLKLIIEVFGWGWADGGGLGEKYLMILCLPEENQVGTHDCLYRGGFASLLSQNNYCATLRI